MKTDIKILKIGLLATAAILAPVATMMIQYELQEDEEHEFEGDEIELATIQTETAILSEQNQATSAPATPKAPTKPKTGRRGNKFLKLEDCLKFFRRCTSRKKKQTFHRPKPAFNWAQELISDKGERPFIFKLNIG